MIVREQEWQPYFFNSKGGDTLSSRRRSDVADGSNLRVVRKYLYTVVTTMHKSRFEIPCNGMCI